MERIKFSDLLIQKMKTSKITQIKLADMLGITTRSLRDKIKNNSFRVSEIFHLKHLFNIDEND